VSYGPGSTVFSVENETRKFFYFLGVLLKVFSINLRQGTDR